MFDQAKLAVVAYAEVSGSDGSSTRTNSGIVTTRIGLGTYQLSLPVANQNQLGLTQFSDRDLIFVQPINNGYTTAPAVPLAVTAVNDSTLGFPTAQVPAATSKDQNKLVLIGSSTTTAVDSDFSVLILRTLTVPTVGGPA